MTRSADTVFASTVKRAMQSMPSDDLKQLLRALNVAAGLHRDATPEQLAEELERQANE